MASNYHPTAKDWYKILKVNNTASVQEIKTAYRQLAMEFHPDKHNGCPEKLEKFKEINEAYENLKDVSKRNQYDFNIGHRYNKNRRTPPPKDYRKVYAPRPPPDWKTTWDHQKHYDMHYGDGFLKEAIEEAKRKAKREAVEYKSPLGKGFSFSYESGSENLNFNPYSKSSRQGPPTIEFMYEEYEISGSNLGQAKQSRREIIVENLYERRSERLKEQEIYRQREQEFHSSSKSHSMASSFRKPTVKSNDTCVIL